MLLWYHFNSCLATSMYHMRRHCMKVEVNVNCPSWQRLVFASRTSEKTRWQSSPRSLWPSARPSPSWACSLLWGSSGNQVRCSVLFSFLRIRSHFYVGSMFLMRRLHWTRSCASSPDNSLSDESFLMLSNHLRFSLPILLSLGTFITITLLPTYSSSSLLNTCPSSYLACPVIWGRRYSWLASSSILPCLTRCPLSTLSL